MAQIKYFTEGVPVEFSAQEQLRNVAQLPFIHPHLAVMPDVHWGMGATVGSVIPTLGAIVPAAVGVDIGCGMAAVQTNLVAEDLPDSLLNLRMAIEAKVPVGFNDHGDNLANGIETRWRTRFMDDYNEIQAKYPNTSTRKSPARQLGTLGGGNHFVEICLDETDAVWVMLHSGSRGVGNRIGQNFINLAKEEMLKNDVHLPDKNLGFLTENTELFNDYVRAVDWAQRYAAENRRQMLISVLDVMAKTFGVLFDVTAEAVNCHHNYVNQEVHGGASVYVTRKGAVSARKGELGIIPGSMGAKSFIVRGKGNLDSLCSCSHGAGRAMSRGEAKRKFTVEDHVLATAGVECRKDEGVIDETPAAYKDIDAVMAAQKDLVEIVHTLKQVLCIKG